MLTNMSRSSDNKKYSEVMKQFDELNVSEFSLDLGNGELKYKLKGESKDTSSHVYSVPNVSLFANEILGGDSDSNYRKRYDAANPNDPLKYDLIPVSDNSFILNLIPTLLMLGVMIFFFISATKAFAILSLDYSQCTSCTFRACFFKLFLYFNFRDNV